MLNPEATQTMTVRELATALEGQMREFGYAESSLNTYRGICAKIARYFETQGVERFDINLGRKFIVEYGGTQFDTEKGFKNYYRAVHMLSDLQRYGMVFKYTRVNQFEFSEGYRLLFEEFLAHIRRRGIADSSVDRVRKILRRFESFLLNRDISRFHQIGLNHVNIYLETLAGYSKNTISFTVSYLRQLMDFAFQNGYHSQNFAIALPHIKYSQSAHLPAVFTPDEIERILKNIDTNSPIGKRNYAIILLLARLGIRISDVLKLQFNSIDWERKRIYIQQQKTGTAIELPLLEDVGWAMIDYLQNARPKTSCQNIFVCHNPPFDQIRYWMAKDISRAVQKAGIKTPPNKTVGAHTFRHSLATNLLNKGAGLTEIAQTLGHTSPESTEGYIALSMETLRVCALEVNL